jgi:hypothetical protein
MGGMKSGTGDVWGSDDEEADEDVQAEAAESGSEEDADAATSRGTVGEEREARASDAGSTERADAAGFGGSGGQASDNEVASENDIAEDSLSNSGASDDNNQDSGQPYVVRRMLKDKSVQFERDERLTFFVHDDVKSGEQELETETQELFGRDIPVFDIREAVYRAALQNRDAVIQELEEMGYTRD